MYYDYTNPHAVMAGGIIAIGKKRGMNVSASLRTDVDNPQQVYVLVDPKAEDLLYVDALVSHVYDTLNVDPNVVDVRVDKGVVLI